jgi:hypothetical protein
MTTVTVHTCAKVKQYGPRAIEGLHKIKAMGVDKWAAEIQKKVDADYSYLDEKPSLLRVLLCAFDVY